MADSTLGRRDQFGSLTIYLLPGICFHVFMFSRACSFVFVGFVCVSLALFVGLFDWLIFVSLLVCLFAVSFLIAFWSVLFCYLLPGAYFPRSALFCVFGSGFPSTISVLFLVILVYTVCMTRSLPENTNQVYDYYIPGSCVPIPCHCAPHSPLPSTCFSPGHSSLATTNDDGHLSWCGSCLGVFVVCFSDRIFWTL